jgi:hypothetical protein
MLLPLLRGKCPLETRSVLSGNNLQDNIPDIFSVLSVDNVVGFICLEVLEQC